MARRVILGPKLDTAAAATLRSEILEAAGGDLVLDASAVEQIGGLCLELLMSAAALWQRDGHAVTIEGASPQMVENLGRFGLTPDTLLESAA